MVEREQILRFDTEVLRSTFNGARLRDTTFVNSRKDLLDNIIEYGTTLYSMSKDNETAELRGELLKMLRLREEVQAHSRALAAVEASYQVQGLEPTDFKKAIKQHMDNDSILRGYDPESDSVVREFDEGTVKSGQEPQPQELGDDDELVMEDSMGGFRNEKCPLSLKRLLDIEDPVEDQLGFVYEKSYILDHLSRAPNRHNGAECPMHGTRHFIRHADLKPSKKLVREQKRVRLGMPSVLQSSHVGRAEEVVLDAD